MKTVRSEQIGKVTLRLVETDTGYIGLLITGGVKKAQVEGIDADAVWLELRGQAGKASPDYFGFDGARSRFLHWFPEGFHSDRFDRTERAYKVAAKAKLDEHAPLELAATGTGYGEAVLSAFRATNLLSPFEKTRLQPMLRGSDADAFIQAAARFAMGEIKPALAMMERLLRPHDNAKWTVVTYLPFLWRPDQHMFLKPVVTQDYASRVGHPFQHDYSAALEAPVYESLLNMMAETGREMSDLAPRDNIDLQSLVWVVGDYTEGDEPETLKG